MNREGILNQVRIKLDEFTPQGVDLPFDDFIGPILDESAKDVARAAPLHMLNASSIVTGTSSVKTVNSITTITLSDLNNPYRAGDHVDISGMNNTNYNDGWFILDVNDNTIIINTGTADDTLTTDTGGQIRQNDKYSTTQKKYYIPVPADFLRLYEIKFSHWPYPVREAIMVNSRHGKMQENSTLESWTFAPSVIIKDTDTPVDTDPVRKYFVCHKVQVTPSPLPRVLYIKVPKPETLADELVDALSWLAASKILQISGESDKAQGAMQQYVSAIAILLQDLKH